MRPGELSPGTGRRHSRLISAHGRSVTPISRGLANALGFRPGGVLFWAFAQEINRRFPSRHEAPGPAVRGNGEIRKTALAALCLGASARAETEGKREQIGSKDPDDLPPGDRRQNGAMIGRTTAVRVPKPVRCARRCRGVCPGRRILLRDDDSSARESRRETAVTPVRIRLVLLG